MQGQGRGRWSVVDVTPVDGEKCGTGKYASKKIHTRIDPYVKDLQRVLEVYIYVPAVLSIRPVSLSLYLLPFCQHSF